MPRKKITRKPIGTDGYIRTTTNLFAKQGMEYLSVAAAAASSSASGCLLNSYTFERVPMHLRFCSIDDALIETINSAGALPVKIHMALSARAHAESPNGDARIDYSVGELMADLGYTKAVNGGYRKRDRDAVYDALLVLSRLNIEFRETIREHGVTTTLRHICRLWVFSGLTFVDEGEKNTWNLLRFSVRYGPFEDCEKRQAANNKTGLVPECLLYLTNRDQDRWPLLIGAYVCLLGRFGEYGSRIFTADEIDRATGLAITYADRDDRRQKIRDDALAYLKAEGIILAWEQLLPNRTSDNSVRIIYNPGLKARCRESRPPERLLDRLTMAPTFMDADAEEETFDYSKLEASLK
jgi:hypothetical protein